MTEETKFSEVSDAEHKTRLLEGAGWGLLLLWLGVTMLFSLGSPVFLVGLGIIVLGVQSMRSRWNMKPERFWLVLGAVFIVAGILDVFGLGFSLVPLALIVFGLMALYGVYKRSAEHAG